MAMLSLLVLGLLPVACSNSTGRAPAATSQSGFSSPTATSVGEDPSATTDTDAGATQEASPSPSPAAMPLQMQYDRILGLAPVRPGNVDLFMTEYLEQAVYPEAYPEGAPMEPAASAPVDLQTVRADLNGFLVEALGADSADVRATLALFDDPAVQQRVPDARLRAAFVLLNLTIGAPLIDAYLTSPVYGGTLNWIETGRAFTEETWPGPDGKQHVGISSIYRFEHPAHVAPSIIHALTHHDANFSYPEDVVTLATVTVSYLQLVDLVPVIAYEGTELARINNTFAMALLNSHKLGDSDIRVIVPGGTSVLPGSPHDAADFWSLLFVSDGVSEPSPNYDQVLGNLLEPEIKLPDPLRLDRSLVELVSGNISEEVLSEASRVRFWVLYTMISTDEIAMLLDLTREETVGRFDLAEIVAIVEGSS